MNRLTRAAMVLLFVIPAAATATIQRSHENKKDSDGDGLSDFQETFKYLSDPNASDSDGDGVPDGDWIERREHQYIIRSVVQVMRPVTPEYLNDDFQDVRVLDETEDYVELEIIHYPFSRAPKAITSNPKWRRTARPLKPWIEPGPSSDWTPALRRQLERDLETDGIDIDKLDDRQVIESVSKWLCDRAPQTSGCTSFITAWDKKGRRTIPEMFRKNLEGNLRERHRTLE
ncbi:MAG: hypothetical protein KDB53_14770, partial [Planctomycetes bacterium]|nr:hypothetical protein [Planctomycetota bacterium]